MNRDITLLRFILASVDNIALHAAGSGSDFTKERAISYELIALGEAVKDISLELKNIHPTIPWHLISGTRDRLAHDYEDVSSKIIWNIVRTHLPQLASDIQAILSTLEAS